MFREYFCAINDHSGTAKILERPDEHPWLPGWNLVQCLELICQKVYPSCKKLGERRLQPASSHRHLQRAGSSSQANKNCEKLLLSVQLALTLELMLALSTRGKYLPQRHHASQPLQTSGLGLQVAKKNSKSLIVRQSCHMLEQDRATLDFTERQ